MFDPLDTVLGHVTCSVALKVKIFQAIMFDNFIIPMIDLGLAVALRLSATCSKFAETFGELDLVEADSAIASVVQGWLNCFIGVAALGDITYTSEDSDES